MSIFADFRKQYPQYDDMSDAALGKALHKKFYSDVPYKEFVNSAINKAFPRQDWEGAQTRAVQSAAEDLNPLEKMAIGFREQTRTAAGNIAGLFGNEEARDQAMRERALTEHVGGPAAFAGRVAPTALATARVPAGLFPSVASGAISGGLTSENPAVGALLGGGGGAIGTGIGALGGRLGNSVRSKWAERAIKGYDDTSEYLRQFQEMGGRITPGAAARSNWRMTVDDIIANTPIAGSPYQSIARQNKRLLTKLATRVLGQNTNEISPSVLQKMDDFLEKQFDDVADQLDFVPINPQLADDISGLLRKNSIKDIDFKGGAISGREYMHLRSKLLEVVRSSKDLVDDAWDSIDDLDEIVEGIAPKGFKRMYAMARERYKTMLALERYQRGIDQEGLANAGTLNNAFEKVFRKQFTRDQPTILPETKDLFTGIRAMSTGRASNLFGGSPTYRRAVPTLLALAGILSPAIPLTALGGLAASRAMLAAPSAAAARAGGLAGRSLASGIPTE